MHFSSNIKLLRKRKGRTQDDVAFTLKLKRSTLSGYENEIAQPGIEALMAISKYYSVSIDTLIKIDLASLSESQLSQLEKGSDVFITGSKLRILATTVDSRNYENIELVPLRAKAGYTNGYADVEFIRGLQAFQLPFLSRQKKYRTFQISGDSMLPIPDGSWVTGEYVENWHSIRDRHAFIILTLDEGIVFKVAENKIKKDGVLTLHSFNPAYKPYDIPVNQIREVWKFVNYISAQLPEPNTYSENIAKTIENLRTDVDHLKRISVTTGKLF